MFIQPRILFSVLAVFILAAGNAQSYQLNGKVQNSRNEVLAGATIFVKETGKQVVADVEGRFYILLESGKKYTVTISNAGYETRVVPDVDVRANQDNTLVIIMVESSRSSLEGVTIKATSRRQENTSALLAFQRSNTALSSGLAADFIRRTPDRNTGEVLKRVSGASIQDNKFVIVRGLSDRYNSAMINNAQLPSSEPDKKAFSFDIIPSSLVDNIIINKTATPELPGEFAGGLIQINTKDVPARNMLSIGMSTGFNMQSVFRNFTGNERSGSDWLGFSGGSRSLPETFPGTRQEFTGGTMEQKLAWTALLKSGVYREKNTTAAPTQTYNITWGNTAELKNGGRLGTILSVQYRNSMLKYAVERRLNQSSDGENIVQLHDQQNRYSVNVGVLANITYIRGRHKISFKNLFNQLLEDNYYLRNGWNKDRIQDISFRSSVLSQRTLYSGQLEGNHQLGSGGGRFTWNGNFSYNRKSQPDLRTVSYNRAMGTASEFELNDDDTRRFFSDLSDFSYGASGSMFLPFTVSDRKQSFRAGGSTVIRIRDFRSRIFQYEAASFSGFDENKAFLPFDQIFSPENIALNGYVLDEFTNNDDKYFGVSALNAMYAMFDNKIGEKIRLVWGVRAENFQQFLTTKNKSAQRVIVETGKWDVLPSFNFTFSPDTRNSVRIAGSRTVARPEFREIAPFSFYDYESNYGVNGNPGLLRTAILNGDIRYEFYPKGGEAITVGGFYKHFDDPIELRLDNSSVIDRRNYGYTNADKAYTAGVEFEIRKNLDIINKRLQDFSVFANLTYTYSKVNLQGSKPRSRPLQGQSPYLANLGLQYNSKAGEWSGTILFNRMGQRLALVGNDEFPDVYERPRDQLDIQLAKKLFHERAEIRIVWADIFNQQYFFYENTNSSKAFNSGKDRLFYAYTPGSTVTLGFTYNFNPGKK